MGLLSQGTPLEWEESKQHIQHVKEEGIKQFLHVYNAHKHSRNTVLKWGDEVEYTLLIKDPADGNYKLLADAPALLAQLEEAETGAVSSTQVVWHPEYSNWQIEGTPADPYRCYVTDLLLVEPNMKLRRSVVQGLLPPGTICLSVTNVPIMGKPRCCLPAMEPGGPVSMSDFFSDSIINPHPRFATLTANIRRRRGEKVDIRMPIFEDAATAKTDEEAGTDPDTKLPNPSVASQIGMDCMAFGMGSSCLQVTLQARDVNEGRILYDQLATLAPIMLALTAATPAWRGTLAATDVRWDVIGMSVDDRTPGERGAEPLQPGEQLLAKSRYSSISRYIAPRPAAGTASGSAESEAEDDLGLDLELEPEPEPAGEPAAESAAESAAAKVVCPFNAPPHLPEYDDVEAPIHQPTYDTLIKAGIDDVLAQHVAHLYVRDPLVIYNEKLVQDHTQEIDHFENIQSTNWNSMRFKLPPPGTDIGWRVEFRTMELQLTDFENAAFSIFTILISRVIIAFNLVSFAARAPSEDDH